MDTLIYIGASVAGIIALLLFAKWTYKVAAPDKALMRTGLGKTLVKVAGGAFVIPVFQKHKFVDLCMLTVNADQDTIMTMTGIPIKVDWTAQIRPDTGGDSYEALITYARSFLERGPDGVKGDVKLTLTGSVRDVVAAMTPIEVLQDKATFAEKVKVAVSDEMSGMGLELVSLNIQDVYDDNGYYDNFAAAERELKRQEAENVRAEAERVIRQKKAETDRAAQEAELDAQLAVTEKQRTNALRKAAIKAETDKAEADAAIAGELQETVRLQELEQQRGAAEIVRQEQADLAAQAKQKVALTDAETARKKLEIEAAANAKKAEIEAQAAATVAETAATGKAKAARAEAEGQADAVRLAAQGSADGVRLEAEAEATKIQKTGEAQADAALAKGKADAEAVRLRGLAEAEAERALAEARAAEEGVNFELAKLEIETKARIEVATRTATVMAEIGKNARFVDMSGGSGGGSGTGNILLDTMAGVPALLERMNVTNQAVNPDGESFAETLRGLIAQVADALKNGGSGPAEEEQKPSKDA